MASAEFENFKVHKNQYPILDTDKKIEHMGRLKALDDLVTYLDIIRESLTRELVVNGVKTEDDIYKRDSPLPPDLKRDINELLKDDSSSDKSENDSVTVTI